MMRLIQPVFYRFGPVSHAGDKPQRHEGTHYRAAAVAEEWERYADDGRDADAHTHVFKGLEHDA